MVRGSKEVLQKAAKTLSDILVCPLSKQPLRYCEESNSLISDAIGVAFPVGSNSLLLFPFNFHFLFLFFILLGILRFLVC
ncbi:hypothetical protein ACSQ67_025717 [Phaseolus vulgaris]